METLQENAAGLKKLESTVKGATLEEFWAYQVKGICKHGKRNSETQSLGNVV